MNSAAAAPSRVRPRRRGVFLSGHRQRAARRSSARGANANPAGQIPSLVRRLGCDPAEGVFFRLSVGRVRPAVRRHVGRTRTPRGKFFRSCAVSRGLRRGERSRAGKSFRSRAVSGGFRRGERSRVGQIFSLVRRVGRPSPWERFCAGQILSPVRRFGRPSPRRAFSRGGKS